MKSTTKRINAYHEIRGSRGAAHVQMNNRDGSATVPSSLCFLLSFNTSRWKMRGFQRRFNPSLPTVPAEAGERQGLHVVGIYLIVLLAITGQEVGI